MTKVVILAAGEGVRMRPLTYTRPKVMLPLANKPILEHLLIQAKKSGITDYIFVVGYHDEQVRDYFDDGGKWEVNIEYRTQRKQLGTADAVKMIEGSVSGNFLLINGDVIVTSQDIKKTIGAKYTTLGIIKVEDTKDLGVVELSENKVVHIYEKTEKPPSHMANAGIYLFTPDLFGAISRTPKSPRGEYEITDSLQLMMGKGHDISYQKINYWLDLSYPWDLLPANEYLLKGIESRNLGEIEVNVVMKGQVSIGKDTIVRSGSYIVGPVVIGQDCDIGPNCYIRPYTSIGDGCHVGSAVEVKLGAIIGDRVETGINACINVGSIIGNNTHIGPGAIVSGVILPDSRLL